MTIRLPLQDRLLSSGGSAEIERAGSMINKRFRFEQCWATLGSFQCYDFTRISVSFIISLGLSIFLESVNVPGGIHALEQNEASPASLQDCANCHPDLLIFVELKGVVLVLVCRMPDWLHSVPAPCSFSNPSMHECTCLSVFSFHASSSYSFF